MHLKTEVQFSWFSKIIVSIVADSAIMNVRCLNIYSHAL